MKYAAAICGLMMAAAPAAHALEPEVNLAGRFALTLSQFNSDLSGSDLDVENNASNVRLTAAVEEVGWRGFMAYERAANNDGAGEAVREFFGGISSRYGTLFYGRKATDYRIAGERLDPFYDTSMAGYTGQFSSEGAGFGLSNLTNGFTSNTIAYRSTEWSGFTAGGAVYVNDLPSPNDKHDFGVGAGYAYEAWGVDAGVQYLSLNSPAVFPGAGVANTPGPGQALRLHGSLVRSRWAVGASFEAVEVDAEPDPRSYGFLSGSYQLSGQIRLAASVGTATDTPFDGSGATVGGFYGLNRYFTVYAAGRYVDLESGDRTSVLGLGVKFIFDVDL